MSLFDVCYFCGSSQVYKLAHCKPCLNVIQEQLSWRTQNIRGLQHFYFLSWRRNQNFLVHSLSQAMKCRKIYDCFYRQFWELVRAPIFFQKKYFLLWVPSFSEQAYNHSFGLAKALSDICQYPLCADMECFRPKESQKKKALQLRSQIFWQVMPLFKKSLNEFLQENPDFQFLFVDDILTTGWTLRSLIKELDLPIDRCEALTPIYRVKG